MSPPPRLPSASDYSTAIQNPRHCFADPQLQAGQIKVDRLGLPVGISGNFAVVYQSTLRGTSFAVRCFVRRVPDQQRRYAAISQCLASLRLPAFVDFTYIEHGILVDGVWHPIVRMNWSDGQPLHQYVEHVVVRLRQPALLLDLAGKWCRLIETLRGAGVAHGDLQHGNILVDTQGKFWLVDYDGLYVPALAGLGPAESGPPNYQHPGRRASH